MPSPYGYVSQLADMSGGRLSRQELTKALEAGYPGVGPTASGTGLVYQDLSPTVPVLTSGMSDIKLWTMLPKEDAASLVKDYTVLNEYGYQADDSMFAEEISAGVEDEAQYDPKYERLKFMVKKGRVSDAMTLVRSIVDPEPQAVMTSSQWVIRASERNLFTGDSETNELAYDGFLKRILTQSPADNILDQHGGPLQFALLDQAVSVIRDEPNYGNPTHAFINITAMTEFNRDFISRAGRTELERDGIRGLNFDFESLRTAAGDVQLVGSPFINTGAKGLISPKQDFTKAPGAPTVGTPTPRTPTSGSSNFKSSDAGGYIYWVQATNTFGASPMVQVNQAAINVAQGQVVDIPITMGTNGAAKAFTIFRTVIGEETLTDSQGQIRRYEIARVKNIINGQGGQTVTFTDTNSKMPNTTEVYIFSMDTNVMCWFRLMNLMKIDLAKVATSKDFLVAQIGAPTLKAPGRVALIRNVAKKAA